MRKPRKHYAPPSCDVCYAPLDACDRANPLHRDPYSGTCSCHDDGCPWYERTTDYARDAFTSERAL